MRLVSLLAFHVTFIVGALGCGGTTESTGASGSGGSGGAGPDGLLPCDVAELLATDCVSCHSAPPIAGVPMPLMTYADLAAQSPLGGTYAERALLRMKDPVAPMPPLPTAVATPDGVALFEAWVNAGLPDGECEEAGMGGPSIYDTPVTCTSNSQWTGGNAESPNMRPGGACIQCHTDLNEGPRFSIAGTVYPSAHEPDDCNGANGTAGMYVEITDANQTVIQIPVRSSGNFFYEVYKGTVVMPVHARVVNGESVRAMAGAVDNGDCNTCHTVDGSGTPQAPGRIMAP